MRLFLGCVLGVALALSPALAGANDSRSGGSGDAKVSDANSNSASEAAAQPNASAASAKNDTESELPAAAPAPASDSSSSVSSTPAPSADAAATASASLPASPAASNSSSTSKKSAKSAKSAASQEPQKAETGPASPLSFNIGSAKFTPGGFMDLTDFFRTKDIGSGIGTSFNGVPYNNSLPLGALTEDHLSLQNSRLALRVDSNVAGGGVIGYVETDFLGFTNDNLNVTSNSDTLRLRVYFIDYRRGKLEILGGQDWSMVTPSRTGIAAMPADVFNTQDMDTNYNVGLTWERTPQFRIVIHPTNTFALGFAIENPQQYTGSAVTFPTVPIAFNTTQVNTGESLNSTAIAGSPSTAVNTLATPDVAPDVVVKAAFDPYPTGHAIHLEAYGLFRTFKIDSFTGTTNLGTTTIHGGAGSFNSNFEIFKNFKIFEDAFFSSGGGREIGNSNVPDFIVTPAASATSLLGLSPVRSDAGLLGLEYQVTPKAMFYGYYGYVYIGQDFTGSGCGTTAAPAPCGYGFYPMAGAAGSANSNDRNITEPTIGFIPTFWRNPNYGALSLITQFSYLQRDPWYVAVGSPKNAHAGMAYIDLRYTLP